MEDLGNNYNNIELGCFLEAINEKLDEMINAVNDDSLPHRDTVATLRVLQADLADTIEDYIAAAEKGMQ